MNLFASRAKRTEFYVPHKCVAHKFFVHADEICDCKVWCKFAEKHLKPKILSNRK